LRILVTSRRKDFPKSAGLQTQELDTFSEIESLDFLEKTLERLESEEARKKLSGKLGYLPLALELAASYININGLDISEYLGELEEILTHESMQDDWFKELEITNPTEHEQSLLATFELSWQEVKSETAQMLFMLAGYCAPNTPIPRLIFEKTLEVKKKEFTKAIYRLNALGLLIASDDLTTIHPLSAAFARIADKDNEQLSKVSDTIFSLSASANQSGLPLQMQPYQQHARACGEFAEKAALEIAGSLWNEFGYSLWQIADHAGAQAAYERAIKISEAAFGPDHPQVATFVNNLGLVLQVLGDLQGAQAAFERALKIDETAFGPDHPSVAIRVNNLGLVLQDLGDLKGAQAAYQRALKIDEAAFGPDHPQVATFVNNLGLVLGDLGDLKGAQAAYERALKIFKQFLPEGHPNIKVVEGNLRSLEEK